ncbi:MAG: hypothetical protein AAF389_19585 [Gemmatimonadota bacterium]
MSLLLEALCEPGPLVTVELRPPSSELDADAGMGAWIDLHHTLGRLTRKEVFVFLTDNAVGAAEEENLAHVGSNVGDTVDLRRIVPILTAKHTLNYCETFAERAVADGFETLTVLGGDVSVPPPRCVPHGRDLREILAGRVSTLTLGGWINPHRDPNEQLGFLEADDAHADFALSQIVSHHSLGAVERLLEARRALVSPKPIVFGVFYYRSARRRTLETLSRFFPVPTDELMEEFESGATPEEICARSIRALREVGAEKIYVSNLGERLAGRRLRAVLEHL